MILLTGGAGFIGSNVLADLNAAGRTDVVLVDTLGTGAKWRNIARARFADLVFPDEVERFLAGRRDVEAVIHMGANASTTATDGDAVVRCNLRSSMRLWDWCTGARRPFVYASSAATYGDGAAGFDDRDDDEHLAALRPLNLYAWSKHAFDRWAVERARRAEAPPHWAGLKFFNVYGPNEAHKRHMISVVARKHDELRAGGPATLFRSDRPDVADGAQARDFIHVDDVVAILLWLLDTPAASGLFNVGTGLARTYLDLAHAVCDAAGLERRVAFVDMPEALRGQYQSFTEAPMGKLRAAGYSGAFRSLEDGIAAYVRDHLEIRDPHR